MARDMYAERQTDLNMGIHFVRLLLSMADLQPDLQPQNDQLRDSRPRISCPALRQRPFEVARISQ